MQTVNVKNTANAATHSGMVFSFGGDWEGLSEADDIGPMAGELSRDMSTRHTVYNFEVAETHTYIADGIRVHNKSVLAFIDDHEGTIIDIEFDDNGLPKKVVLSGDDGQSKTTIETTSTNENGTLTVKQTYEWNSPSGRFFVVQEQDYRNNPDGTQSLINSEITKINLFGTATAAPVADILSPFILESLGVDSNFGKIFGGAAVETLIENFVELGLNGLHASALAFSENDGTWDDLVDDAFDDFGDDFAQNLIENSVSFISQLIMLEIFGNKEFEGTDGAVLEAIITAGITDITEYGVDTLLELAGYDGYKPEFFENFTSADKFIQLIFGAVLSDALPDLETVEGAVGSAIAEVFATAILGPGLAELFASKIIGLAIGQILDSIFEKNPEAFADLKYDPISGRWDINFLDSDDDGSESYAEALGSATVSYLNDILSNLKATSHNFTDLVATEIGHYEEHPVDSFGKRYADDEAANAVQMTFVDIVSQMRVNDGDLKIARAIDFENVATNAEGKTPQEAFGMIVSRMKVAADYLTYLENTFAINSLIENFPESAQAIAWVATLAQIADMGLGDAYVATGDSADNYFSTADGNDIIDAGAGDDVIVSFGGMDQLNGGTGNDTIDGGAGADQIDGGTGRDRVVFNHTGLAVALDLASGTGSAGNAEGDVYTSIEDVTGSDYDDVILGNDGTNDLRGGAGDDQISGRGGDDTIYGDDGNDILRGDDGLDALDGGSGDDVLLGGSGADTLNGGAGMDIASYSDASSSLTVSLRSPAGNTGDAAGDTYTGIEGIEGSAFNDSLTASDNGDILIGGLGDDRITGGRGTDQFVYAAGDGSDVIAKYLYGAEDDELTFVDLLRSDITFERPGNGRDVVLRLPDGETILLEQQLSPVMSSGVGSIVFADGETLDKDDIWAEIVELGKADGYVLARDNTHNTFSHKSGDGSYIINDRSSSAYQDQLRLEDVTLSDVVFELASNDRNVMITLPNGDVITITDQYRNSLSYGVESVVFADGQLLNRKEIRELIQEEAKQTGTLHGEHVDDVYTHAAGDGSYTIREYQNGGTDILNLGNFAQNDVSFERLPGSDDLLVHLPNNETITVYRHFDSRGQYDIEKFVFAEGGVLSAPQLAALMGTSGLLDNTLLSGGTGDDTILGTDLENVFVTTEGVDVIEGRNGDDSYSVAMTSDTTTIVEVANGGNDTVYFNSNFSVSTLDVSLTDSDNDGVFDVVLKSRDGSQILIISDAVASDSQTANDTVEAIQFDDGSTYSVQSLIDQFLPMYGTDADDTINGTTSSDVIASSLGDDTLNGGRGNDRYQIELDHGDNVINDSRDGNRIEFGAGITLENLVVTTGTFSGNSHNDLKIAFSNGSGSVLVTDSHSHTSGGISRYIETFSFEDGTELSWSEFLTATVNAGTSGNDVVHSIYTGTEFAASLGDDVTYAWGGDDTHHVELNHGNDVISDDGGNDSIEFGDGITLEDLDVSVGQFFGDYRLDLKIEFINGDGSIVLDRTHANRDEGARYFIETFVFADGTELSWDEFVDSTVNAGTSGDDVLHGAYDGDTFAASLGDDLIYGNENNDTYHVELGHGHDVIRDEGGNDRIEFGEDISLENLHVTVGQVYGDSRRDLMIEFLNGEGSLILERTHSSRDEGPKYFIETFAFADGTEMSWHDFLASTANSGTSADDAYYANDDFEPSEDGPQDGDDIIHGTWSDDTFTSGSGTDVIYGSAGDDVYFIDKVGAATTIYETRFDSDRIVFGDGISRNDLMLSSDDVDENGTLDLIINFRNGTGSVTLGDVLHDVDSDRSKIEFFEFYDGTVLTRDFYKTGSDGYDALNGSSIEDYLFGFRGDDVLDGGGGIDSLDGGEGADTLTGGSGADTFQFKSGDGIDLVTDFDFLEDILEINGKSLNPNDDLPDVTLTQVGLDVFLEYGSGDTILLENVDLTAWLAETAPPPEADGVVTGTSGADVINATTLVDPDGDTVEDIDQVILGLAGEDTIVAGIGDDTISGGLDADTLTGGAGADIFVFTAGDGSDVVTDFDVTADVLEIDGITVDPNATVTGVSIAQSGGDVMISYGSGDAILLLEMDLTAWGTHFATI